GEARFVRDLRAYLQSPQSELAGKGVFLLRHLTRGRGIGFFEASAGEAFYPDFILWVIQDGQQWLTFIDPHGLRHARGSFNDPKVKLHKDLQALQPTLQEHCPQWQVHLASFILSTSPYEEIRRTFGTGQHTREEFEGHNILFPDDAGYVRKLLDKALKEAGA
ncbi:MAG: DEAD/DEAH box helicase family protein, partial [Anaerolineae bacterium]